MKRWFWITDPSQSIQHHHQILDITTSPLMFLALQTPRISRRTLFDSLGPLYTAYGASVNGPVMSESQEPLRIMEKFALLGVLSTLAPRPLANAAEYLLQHQMDTAICSIIHKYISRRDQSWFWDTHSHLDIFGINLDVVIQILESIVPSITQILSV
jgi:hypothetical protein